MKGWNLVLLALAVIELEINSALCVASIINVTHPNRGFLIPWTAVMAGFNAFTIVYLYAKKGGK
jgi:hypothetical protein